MVGGIPARTLEDDGRRLEQAPHVPLAAFWAAGEGLVREFLDTVKLDAATLATISIRGHKRTPSFETTRQDYSGEDSIGQSEER